MRAVFLDRDGVLNTLVYSIRHKRLVSPWTAETFEIIPGAIEAVRSIRQMGYKTVVCSNQPGILKGEMDEAGLKEITERMIDAFQFAPEDIFYCKHHEAFGNPCECRKPKPGLLLQAAEKHGINLSKSFMAGDTWKDIAAGNAAGCKTIYVGNNNPEGLENDIKPDYCALNLLEAVRYLGGPE